MRNQFEREVEQEADIELAFRRAEEALAPDIIKEENFIDLYMGKIMFNAT